MKLTAEELAAAKRQASRFLQPATKTRTDCPRCEGRGQVRTGLGRRACDHKRCPECLGGGTVKLSEEDRSLLKKYPRHTLAQAREIDSERPEYTGGGLTSGFAKLIAQERGDFHLSGDHT